MLDGLPAELVARVGPVGLLAVAVLLVLTGRLLPRAVHEDRLRDKDRQIEYLQAAAAVRDEQAGVRDEQIGKLLPAQEMTVHLLRSLVREAGGDDLVA